MLTQHEILKEVFTLPPSEQREILEKIKNNIERNNYRKGEELSVDEKLAIVESLRGIAAVEGKTPPTKEQWREDRTNYLMEKYK